MMREKENNNKKKHATQSRVQTFEICSKTCVRTERRGDGRDCHCGEDPQAVSGRRHAPLRHDSLLHSGSKRDALYRVRHEGKNGMDGKDTEHNTQR